MLSIAKDFPNVEIVNNDMEFALKNEKEKETTLERKEHLTRLKVIKALLNSMIKFYKLSGNQLKKYSKLEEEQPLKTNIFNSSTSSSYQNFLKLD